MLVNAESSPLLRKGGNSGGDCYLWLELMSAQVFSFFAGMCDDDAKRVIQE